MRDLTAARWRALRPSLVRVRPRGGRRLADFERSSAGVVSRPRTDVPWRDPPPRFCALRRRWARPGVWDAPLAGARAAAGRADLAEVFVDGTAVRAHRKAAGQRGAAPPREPPGARAAA